MTVSDLFRFSRREVSKIADQLCRRRRGLEKRAVEEVDELLRNLIKRQDRSNVSEHRRIELSAAMLAERLLTQRE